MHFGPSESGSSRRARVSSGMAQLAAHPCHAYAFELVRPHSRRDGFAIAYRQF